MSQEIIDDDGLYLKMIDLLRNKEEAKIILSNLKIKIKKKEYPISFLDFSEDEKEKLTNLLKKSTSNLKTRKKLNFHGCYSCKHRIKQFPYGDERVYSSYKPCDLFTRTIILGLYDLKLKCKYYEQCVNGDFKKND